MGKGEGVGWFDGSLKGRCIVLLMRIKRESKRIKLGDLIESKFGIGDYAICYGREKVRIQELWFSIRNRTCHYRVQVIGGEFHSKMWNVEEKDLTEVSS